jgi:hypothetical protein
VRRWRFQRLREQLGVEHPRTRAAFGRYVASLETGIITEQSAGVEAYRAYRRALYQPGYQNRSARTR